VPTYPSAKETVLFEDDLLSADLIDTPDLIEALSSTPAFIILVDVEEWTVGVEAADPPLEPEIKILFIRIILEYGLEDRGWCCPAWIQGWTLI
jgi:hypothetical protein